MHRDVHVVHAICVPMDTTATRFGGFALTTGVAAQF